MTRFTMTREAVIRRPQIGRLTKLQEVTLQRWLGAGALAGVVTSVEETANMIEGGSQ